MAIDRGQGQTATQLTGSIFPVPVALTTIQTAVSEVAHLALTAQEGDVVVRSDENKTYMHNGGSAGTMADYTAIITLGAYTLPEANATTKGGIELFSNTDQSVAANSVSATAAKTYGLQLNSAGQGVVNVPWTDTTTNTMGSGFTVSATTDSNATTITQSDDLFFAAGTGITCTTSADGTVTIANTVTNTNTTYTAGNGMDIVGGSNAITLDLSELPDGTAFVHSTEDEMIYLDNGAQKRKQFSEIGLSSFSNDSLFTAGPTQITAGTGMSGGGTSGVVTLNIGQAVATSDSPTFAGLTLTGSLVSAGNQTLDMSGDISLDAGGGDIFLKAGGITFGSFYRSSGNLYIKSHGDDDDIIFRGIDDGLAINVLTLDMSDAGTAIFESDVKVDDSNKGLILKSPDSTYYRVTVDNSGNLSTASI